MATATKKQTKRDKAPVDLQRLAHMLGFKVVDARRGVIARLPGRSPIAGANRRAA